MVYLRCVICKGIFESPDTLRHKMETGHNNWMFYEEIKMKNLQDILIDFCLPFVILLMLFTLMLLGIDGEVKTLLAATVGWIINSGVKATRKR